MNCCEKIYRRYYNASKESKAYRARPGYLRLKNWVNGLNIAVFFAIFLTYFFSLLTDSSFLLIFLSEEN